nr:plant OB fold protein [Tanacetum cinerariifolium]
MTRVPNKKVPVLVMRNPQQLEAAALERIKEWMFRFEPLFKEGQCYSISNFAIAENSDVVPVQSIAGRKIRRTVVIEDQSKSNQLDCTFWDHWVNMWDEYAQKRNELGHVVFILQLGKVKYWDGTPSIHNALFGTRMFINRGLPKIQAFRQRFKELPPFHVWNQKQRIWTRRKQGKSLGRIHHVPPYWGELYYLRAILNKVRGPMKWDDLKKVDDVLYPTYQDACYARGLLQDDKEYIDCIIYTCQVRVVIGLWY